MIFKTQSEFLEKYQNGIFQTNPLSKIAQNIKEIENEHKKIDQLRSSH